MAHEHNEISEPDSTQPSEATPGIPESASIANHPKTYKAEDLDDRRVRGKILHDLIVEHPDHVWVVNDTDTVYFSGKNLTRNYRVVRALRNHRGEETINYRCSCPDYEKDGRHDCQHTFCDRIRRGEAIVIGTVSAARAKAANAVRRPPRKRKTESGKSISTTQRHARQKMGSEIPRLVTSLGHAYTREHPPTDSRPVGGQMTPDVTRVKALLYKVARSKSADEMVYDFEELRKKGLLELEEGPCPNTFSKWINDPTLTPILKDFFETTKRPFRKREVAGIIDSTKISQMRTATARGVAYLGDQRDGATWMMCHVVVGVETMVVMAATFTKNHVADVTQTIPLVKEAVKTFPLKVVLADKAYESAENINAMFNDYKISAYIPLKKNMVGSKRKKKTMIEAVDVRNWIFDHRVKDFYEFYRFRVKVEGFFSLMKRMAGNHCWSRGRRRDVDSEGPLCVAWINEILCKLIYMNLRTTCTVQEETGWEIDYQTDRFFLAPTEPALVA